MATYHFTIKADKKPSGGRVKALNHVEYIQRQGIYSEDELEKRKEQKFGNNLITSAKKSNAYNGAEALLYTSQFGDIYNTPDGIQVKNNPSIDTISIALMVASETLRAPLIIKGSQKFKRRCIESAVESALDIEFADKKMQENFAKRKEEIENGRKRFEENGGRIIRSRGIRKPVTARGQRNKPRTLAQTRTLMSELSKRNMADNLEKQPTENGAMLLQTDNDVQLDNGRAIRYPLVRRDFSGERRSRSVNAAKQIIKNIERNLDEIQASSHVEYINREKAFAKRGGCIYHSHRLPKWAKDDPVNFFKAADRYEGKGRCRYKEIEFALPNELNLEQNLEIVQRFIDTHLADHYYAFAIHDKIGAMTNGIHNIHVHLMFSERLIDDCEKEKERTAKAFFSYPKRNAKTLAEKRQGGAPKADKWRDKDRAKYTVEMRASYAEIVNETLEKYGITDRVDHRSLKEQRQEAIMNGDEFLAKLLDRVPEKHINPDAFLQEGNPEVEALRLYRAKKQELQNLLFEADQAEKLMREKQILSKSETVQGKTEKLIGTSEFEDSEDSNEEIIIELRSNLLDAVKEFKKWQDVIITKDEAESIAKSEMMNEDERELWGHYQDLLTQERHWKEFLRSIESAKELPENDESKPDMQELVQEIRRKLRQLSDEISSDNIQNGILKLELSFDKPEKRALLQKKISKILFENKHAREKFSKASDRLARATDSLRQVLFAEIIQSDKQETYSTRELFDISRRRYFGLKKEVQRLRKLLEKEEKKVISPERAIYMAKDVLTKGGFRKYRAELREYKKRLERYENSLPKVNLGDEKRALEQLKARLDKDYEQLQKSLTPAKVNDVARGILKKNQPQAEAVERIRKELATAETRFEQARKQMNAVSSQLDHHHSYEYRIPNKMSGGGRSTSVADYIPNYDKAGTIMDAILGSEDAIPNVQVRPMSEDDGMKNWMLMSDLAKQEELRKRWKRNL